MLKFLEITRDSFKIKIQVHFKRFIFFHETQPNTFYIGQTGEKPLRFFF